jgi:hypothetical protein
MRKRQVGRGLDISTSPRDASFPVPPVPAL